MSTIFVQIASYDDDELTKTVNDCIAKSSGNNEIFFGIHECYIDNKTIFDNSNVKIIYSKAPENLGVGKSRYLANKLYDNEDYYLQIDSHTRFIKNWDDLAIKNLNKYWDLENICILTGYPPSYWYENNEREVLDLNSQTTKIKLKKDKNQIDVFKNARTIDQHGVSNDNTYCSESISAGFIFGKGEIHNVIQHPGIFYYGEEFLRAASFYTHGYNLMYPDIPLVFHLYGNHSKRVPCWITFPEEGSSLEEFSAYAIKEILSKNMVNNIFLGSKRPLEQYGNYIDVDFKNGIIRKEAK